MSQLNKRCAKCGESKPAQEFSRDTSRRGGLQSWCRACHQQHERQRQRQYVPDPESVRDRSRSHPSQPYIRAGERFYRWLVLEDGFRQRDRVLCRCDCGTERMVFPDNMMRGGSRSCGCWKSPLIGQHHRTHGLSRHPLFDTWRHMVQRCTNPGNAGWDNYGGRGVKVCERWLGPSGPANFIKDMGPKPTKTHSLERIDNDGDYEPSNCVWATPLEQRANRRNAIPNTKYRELLAENARLRRRIEELGG